MPGESQTGRSTLRVVLGGVLTTMGGPALLLLTLLGELPGFLMGLLFCGPLLLCGILCLTALRHVGLWCAWAVYVSQQIC